MWRKGNNPILMVGIYIGIATVENSMKFLKRIKKKKKCHMTQKSKSWVYIQRREKLTD